VRRRFQPLHYVSPESPVRSGRYTGDSGAKLTHKLTQRLIGGSWCARRCAAGHKQADRRREHRERYPHHECTAVTGEGTEPAACGLRVVASNVAGNHYLRRIPAGHAKHTTPGPSGPTVQVQCVGGGGVSALGPPRTCALSADSANSTFCRCSCTSSGVATATTAGFPATGSSIAS
jgi:hypothetical protein